MTGMLFAAFVTGLQKNLDTLKKIQSALTGK